MEVYINDRALEVPTTEGLHAGDVIDALAVHMEPGEVVTEIELDGRVYAAGDNDLAWRPVEESSRLRVVTVPGRVLGEGLRGDVFMALEIVRAKVAKTAELLERGSTMEAQALLGELLEELRLTLVLDAHSAQLAGQEPVTSPQSLESVAADLLRAQEAGNRTEMSQVLGTGLEPMISRWQEAGASPK